MSLPQIDIETVNANMVKPPLNTTIEKTTSFTEAYISLIFVLVFIIFIAWVLKKIGSTSRFKRSKHLDIVDSIAVGTKERVILIKQGDKLLTIGVTSHTITLLDSQAVIDDPTSTEVQNENAQVHSISNSFKTRLDKALNRNV